MFIRQPAANLQSASMLLLFALLILTLVTGIVGLCQLRKSKYRGFIPFGICGCSVLHYSTRTRYGRLDADSAFSRADAALS